MSGIEFGNRMGKPPDRGKSTPEHLAGEHQPQQTPETQVPRPFAGAEPAREIDPQVDGEKPRTQRLRSVDSPQPPDEGPPATSTVGAEIERQRVDTDALRAKNEAIRSETALEEWETASQLSINEEKADSDIGIAENRAAVEDEAIEVDTETTRKERIFFMWMIPLGLVITVITAVIAGLTGQPLFFAGSGVGLVATGGGLRRLGVLTSPKRREACLLDARTPKKSRNGKGGTSGHPAPRTSPARD